MLLQQRLLAGGLFQALFECGGARAIRLRGFLQFGDIIAKRRGFLIRRRKLGAQFFGLRPLRRQRFIAVGLLRQLLLQQRLLAGSLFQTLFERGGMRAICLRRFLQFGDILAKRRGFLIRCGKLGAQFFGLRPLRCQRFIAVGLLRQLLLQQRLLAGSLFQTLFERGGMRAICLRRFLQFGDILAKRRGFLIRCGKLGAQFFGLRPLRLHRFIAARLLRQLLLQQRLLAGSLIGSQLKVGHLRL